MLILFMYTTDVYSCSVRIYSMYVYVRIYVWDQDIAPRPVMYVYIWGT